MDDVRFDSLVAALAMGGSRRRLLGTLLGGMFAGLLGAADTATARRRRRKKKKKCPFGRPPCGNDCCTLGEGCLGNRCVHHCRDRRLDGGESDVDCGRVCDGVLGDPGEGLCLRRKRCDGP